MTKLPNPFEVLNRPNPFKPTALPAIEFVAPVAKPKRQKGKIAQQREWERATMATCEAVAGWPNGRPK